MILTPNNKLSAKEKGSQYIFLAGSISSKFKVNWREEVINKLKGQRLYLDPTNADFHSLNEIEIKNQINWELYGLEKADKILLNLLPESTSPISLVELGLYVNTNKLTVVCPKEFYKSRYVHTICMKYNTPYFLTLDKAIKYINQQFF